MELNKLACECILVLSVPYYLVKPFQLFYGRSFKMKPVICIALLLTLSLATLALSPLCHAQNLPASLNSSIELVRAGAQADRVTIITGAMNFSDKDGAVFWPMYRRYEYERSRLDDRRVSVIKEYAAKYPSLTDGEAKEMAVKMFDCDRSLATLKRKYFKKFNSVLPAFTVTKFFQVEHRIDLMMDMRVDATLPPLVQAQIETQE